MKNSLMKYWFNDFEREAFPAWAFERTGRSLESVDFAVRTDVKEDETQYLFHFDLPGVKKEDVKIQLEGRELTVTGERSSSERKDDETYHREERLFGKFRRSFYLPENVDATKTEAEFKDGVLTISIAKKPETQPKVIPIKVQ